jgi:glutamine amidotransferase
VFAHNGDIPSFAEHGARLRAEVDPRLARYILGDTDSEVIFFLVLTELLRRGPLSMPYELRDVVQAMTSALDRVRDLCESGGDERPCLLTCILTDGGTMVATQGGKELYYSTFKQRCSDRDECPSLSVECEAPTKSGFVNHLIFSSQPLSGENVWHEMAPGDLVAVDGRMRLYQERTGRITLPIVRGA